MSVRTLRSGLILLLLGALVVGLAGCSSLGKKKNKNRLEGKRISVMTLQSGLTADPRLADVQVRLPKPYTNADWPLVAGYPTHAMQHLELAQTLSTKWRTSAGTGSGGNVRLVAPPVVAGGVIYVFDAKSNVSATRAATGKRLWRVAVRSKKKKEKKEQGFGGGIGVAGERVFVSSGVGFVVALDAANGSEIWRTEIGLPLRGSPTIADGRVFVITNDNQLYALDEKTGENLWSHVGIAENAEMMGAASPAVIGDVVVVAYSSGELFALRVENGRVAWTDSLTRTGRMTPLSSLNDIDGSPVVYHGRVYAISHSGRMVAIDLRSGARVWERNVAGVQTPWIAGDFIYIVTVQGDVVCLSARSGRVRWVTPLQRFKNVKKKKGAIRWTGPVLAGDRLVVASSHGYVVSLSPYDGKPLGAAKLSSSVFLSPIVANDTLYILTDKAQLYALR
jgi:outer membrane protein assembly factor BamB